MTTNFQTKPRWLEYLAYGMKTAIFLSTFLDIVIKIEKHFMSRLDIKRKWHQMRKNRHDTWISIFLRLWKVSCVGSIDLCYWLHPRILFLNNSDPYFDNFTNDGQSETKMMKFFDNGKYMVGSNQVTAESAFSKRSQSCII